MHFGSLLTAIVSYIDAKTNNGKWFLRIDDADHYRETKNAKSLILKALDSHGFEWDGTPSYQTQSKEQYDEIKNYLHKKNYTYNCSCTRKKLSKTKKGFNGPIYNGLCRNKTISQDNSSRVILTKSFIEFIDKIQGNQSCDLKKEVGDFIVWRRDNIISYHLATVIDDNDKRINSVVRGFDLMRPTFCQLYLQNILGYKSPEYSHIPIAVNRFNKKLSKQSGAKELNLKSNTVNLFFGLHALNQEPPERLKHENIQNIWQWAFENWDIQKLIDIKHIKTNY